MKRFNRQRFLAFGVLGVFNAIALALYALGLATHGTGRAAGAQPVLFVMILLCLLAAFVASVKRGHDLGRPGWQIFLAYWISMVGGPLLLVLVGYLAMARGEDRENAYGLPSAPAGPGSWLLAIVVLALPWVTFVIAAHAG